MTSPDSEIDEDAPPPPPRFSLRTLLLSVTLLALLFSLPFVGLGAIVTVMLFAVLIIAQIPLYFLFGAFRRQDRD